MSYGIITWGKNGEVIMDPAKRIARFVGSFSTGTSGGSRNVTMPDHSGDVFYFTQGASGDLMDSYPDVTLTGTTFSWSFPTFKVGNNTSVPRALTVHYGVY